MAKTVQFTHFFIKGIKSRTDCRSLYSFVTLYPYRGRSCCRSGLFRLRREHSAIQVNPGSTGDCSCKIQRVRCYLQSGSLSSDVHSSHGAWMKDAATEFCVRPSIAYNQKGHCIGVRRMQPTNFQQARGYIPPFKEPKPLASNPIDTATIQPHSPK